MNLSGLKESLVRVLERLLEGREANDTAGSILFIIYVFGSAALVSRFCTWLKGGG